mmetsp:Transcript_55480/g.119758  ORF Transcript_55480/g.119758 Transcript_55480/m.119758 type:complete len:289 (+) Transcript_55480:42-908(+)
MQAQVHAPVRALKCKREPGRTQSPGKHCGSGAGRRRLLEGRPLNWRAPSSNRSEIFSRRFPPWSFLRNLDAFRALNVPEVEFQKGFHKPEEFWKVDARCSLLVEKAPSGLLELGRQRRSIPFAERAEATHHLPNIVDAEFPGALCFSFVEELPEAVNLLPGESRFLHSAHLLVYHLLCLDVVELSNHSDDVLEIHGPAAGRGRFPHECLEAGAELVCHDREDAPDEATQLREGDTAIVIRIALLEGCPQCDYFLIGVAGIPLILSPRVLTVLDSCPHEGLHAGATPAI